MEQQPLRLIGKQLRVRDPVGSRRSWCRRPRERRRSPPHPRGPHGVARTLVQHRRLGKPRRARTSHGTRVVDFLADRQAWGVPRAGGRRQRQQRRWPLASRAVKLGVAHPDVEQVGQVDRPCPAFGYRDEPPRREPTLRQLFCLYFVHRPVITRGAKERGAQRFDVVAQLHRQSDDPARSRPLDCRALHGWVIQDPLKLAARLAEAPGDAQGGRMLPADVGVAPQCRRGRQALVVAQRCLGIAAVQRRAHQQRREVVAIRTLEEVAPCLEDGDRARRDTVAVHAPRSPERLGGRRSRDLAHFLVGDRVGEQRHGKHRVRRRVEERLDIVEQSGVGAVPPIQHLQ